jgi:glycosyltransferase involved in cell wall biosynthesis
VRIAQLAPNVERVPPIGYGGTEVVIDLLTSGLVERGHEVTLFASNDSITKARLISVTDISLRTNMQVLTRQWQAFDLQTLLTLKEMQEEFDIVHNHMGYQALPYLDQLNCANVTTNHNPIKPYNWPIYKRFAHLPYVAISKAYLRLNKPEELNYVATIYNGVDLTRFPLPSKKSRSYLLFLGRICQDKGTRRAVDLANALKIPLKIAGKIDEVDRPYFEDEVRPYLNQEIQYIGEVDHEAKVALYQEAIALVHAVAFEEPFGLTMVEALACGTPVMAFEKGSVQEILSDPDTSIIARSIEELAERFSELKAIDPKACRKRVQDNFSKELMVANYESVYQNLIEQKLTHRYAEYSKNR